MKQRIWTGLVAGTGFLALLALGGYWFKALMLLMAAAGYLEYVRMNKLNRTGLPSVIGLLVLLYIVFAREIGQWADRWSGFGIPELIWFGLFALLAVTVLTKNRIGIDQAALVLLGSLYIGFGFQYMVYTESLDNGLFWTLLLFGCIWATDSGAYFTGRAIGKRLLWPSISPKKTVEGALGAIVFSMGAAVVFSLFAPDLLSIGQALLIGAAVSVSGQLGDLIQSAYKRVRGIKDTGTILPGHGGVLDRCDSWLIVFPFIHILALLPAG